MKQLVGPYRIQSLLGHGGMGVVYLGIHDHLGREVAVKALAPELTQHPQFRERFFTEARVQAKLQHTNIIAIYDLIEDEGNFFIVMEYVPGPTLENLLKGGVTNGWEVDHALALFRQVLAGLDYAHSKGVIHRDVKSSNVLVAEGDQVKLTDFGIALLIGDKRLTASQSTIGTPTYMSPEQILRPRTVDHRSDVYSAAVVLYEMLAGQPPFDAETEYEIKKLQIEASAPDVRAVNPKVSEAVAKAIAIALRKEPDERFPSAGAFLRELQGVGAPLSTLSSTPEPPRASSPQSSTETVATPVPSSWMLPTPSKKRWTIAAMLVLLVGLPLVFLSLPEEEPARDETGGPSVQAAEALSMPSEKGPALPAAELLSAQVGSPTEEVPSPQPPPIQPFPADSPRQPVPREADDVDLIALRKGIRQRIENARRKISNQAFEAARREVEALLTLIEGRPHGLEQERQAVRQLEQALASAIQAHERAEVAREGERQLREARNALEQGNRPMARDLAQALLNSPGISEPMASQAREVIEQSQERETDGRPATIHKLRISGVEIHPQVVPPGGRAMAVAHATVTPSFREPLTVNVRAKVMRSLEEITDPISQKVTIPPGGSSWRINIPIRIPEGVASGDCYIDVAVWDSLEQMRASGRIGFTVQ